MASNTNYNPLMNGISEEELRHFLSIGDNSEATIDRIVDEFRSDRRLKLWKKAMDTAPLLPECIATGQHASFQGCEICENYWTPEKIDALNESQSILDSI